MVFRHCFGKYDGGRRIVLQSPKPCASGLERLTDTVKTAYFLVVFLSAQEKLFGPYLRSISGEMVLASINPVGEYTARSISHAVDRKCV